MGLTQVDNDGLKKPINLADNERVRFGAGNDLQIYHDGTHSRISDEGTGSLLIQTNGTNIQLNKGTTENMLVAIPDGAVELYHNNSKKLETTSSGVKIGAGSTVTPDANADAFVIDEGAADTGLSILSTTTGRIYFGDAADDEAGSIRYVHSDNSMRFETASSEAMRVDSNGNLGIGTTSITERLTVFSNNDTSAVDNGLAVYRSAGDDKVNINCQGGAARFISDGGSSYIPTRFGRYNGTTLVEDVTIDNAGRLLVGTTSEFSGGLSTTLIQGVAAGGGFVGLARNDTTVFNGSGIGGLRFYANDPSGYNDVGIIQCVADGTHDTDDYPTRLEFHTTSDNASSPTERLRITSGGKIQVTGTRAGSLQPSDNDTLELFTSASDGAVNTGCGLSFYNNDGNGAEIGGTIQVAKENGSINNTAGYMRFSTRANNSDPAERMRITSGGHILANTTSVLDLGSSTTSGINLNVNNIIVASRSSGESLSLQRTNSNGNIALFFKGTSSVGSIAVDNSSTSFNTSSDYRLKENVVDLSDAITRVKQLAPKRFNFIVEPDETVDGFLAHEAQTVVPEAVTGTHNEVDDDGNAVMQGIDQSKLVPLLTAALQEAIAKIETLETQNASLEARLTALEGGS
jgi:hypothetical protein